MNNILYLPTRYFPAISGAEFYLQRMAEIFTSKYEYNINIFTSNALDFKALRDPQGKIIEVSNKFYDKVNELKINRFTIDYKISLEDRIKNIKNIKQFRDLNISEECLKSLLKNGPYISELIDFFLKNQNLNFDLIHTTFFPYFNLLISLIIGRLINKPVICTPFFHFSNPRYKNEVLIEVLKNFNILIACTKLEKKFLIEHYGFLEEKIKVIPMGVDFKIFNGVHKTEFKDYYFKEQFFKKKEKKYKMVLFSGYKNYEKGSISILKAIPHVLKKNKKVYFIFIGPATMAYKMELAKIQKFKYARIINFTPENLTGYYDKKKLTAFKEADVYLMPSRSDAFGIAFLEAWAAGKPVIGANIGATPEVIRNNVDGFLVEFDNPKHISEILVKLLKNRNLRKKLGTAGNTKVKQNYTWDKIAQKTHNLYQDLINKKN